MLSPYILFYFGAAFLDLSEEELQFQLKTHLYLLEVYEMQGRVWIPSI